MLDRVNTEPIIPSLHLNLDDSNEPSSFFDNKNEWKPEPGIIPEPIAGREGVYRPWEHTPANLHDPRVIEHQDEVYDQFTVIMRDHVPAHVDERLKEFVETLYMMREAERRTKNSENFTRREREPSDVSNPAISEFVDKMLIGTATAQEVLGAMDALGIVSTEVAKLMHVLGYRLEYIDDMRAEVSDAIRALGGVVYDQPQEEFEILTQDNLADPAAKLEFALSMKRRRHIGTIGDIEVYERSSFIVRIDPESYFDQDLADHLRRMDIEGMLPIVDGDPIWKTVIMEGTPFLTQVKHLLAINDLVTIIPLSTTMYAHNSVAEHHVMNREAHEAHAQRLLTNAVLNSFYESFIATD